MWQRQCLAMRFVEVGNEIPGEAVAQKGSPSEGQLETLISRFRSVEIEQDVTGSIASPDIVYDLVFGLFAVEGRINPKPVVQEAQFGTDLVRLGKFRFQVKLGTAQPVP